MAHPGGVVKCNDQAVETHFVNDAPGRRSLIVTKEAYNLPYRDFN